MDTRYTKYMIIRVWHGLLKMPKHDEKWHIDDISDEYQELIEARNWLEKWSELSDVAYVYSRARWSGHKTVDSPISRPYRIVGYVYMFPKYSLRFWFFRRAGKALGSVGNVREVRNPQKLHKLHHIAGKYDLPADDFAKRCQDQLRYWPLLP